MPPRKTEQKERELVELNLILVKINIAIAIINFIKDMFF